MIVNIVLRELIMIRRLCEYLICLMLINVSLFTKELYLINNNLDQFENYLTSECIEYIYADEVSVVFDYEKIESYLDIYFKDCEIKRISYREFNITYTLRKGIILKEIKESFFIREGNLYDG